MILQGPEGDPGSIDQDVRDVLARDEFRYDPTWFDRVSEWIGEQLERLFGGGEVTAGGSAFTGGIGAVVAWILILAAVAAVVAVVVYVVLNRIRVPPSDDGSATEVEVEHRRSAAAWSDDAERLEAEGDWKGALRARYRHLVRTLVDRGQLPDVAGRTTGELREDLAATTPDASAAFDTASTLFELAWYAHVDTGRDENGRFRVAADEVLACARRSGVDDRGRGPGPGSGGGVAVEVRA
jgi:hypothetical protein